MTLLLAYYGEHVLNFLFTVFCLQKENSWILEHSLIDLRWFTIDCIDDLQTVYDKSDDLLSAYHYIGCIT